MTGLNYPDNLYADHEERKARRSQQPTGAYRSTDTIQRLRVLPLVNADLHKRIAKGANDYGEPLTTHNGRDALWDAYEEALDLCLYLRQAIEERNQPTSCNGKNQPTGCEPERVQKWDPRWSLPPGGSTAALPKQDGEFLWNGPLPPNCDGPSARDVRAPHPMQAEAIRDHDERLAGGESRL